MGGSEIEAQRVCVALMKREYRPLVICAGGPPMPPLRRWTDPVGVPVLLFGHRVHGKWRDWIFAFGTVWTMIRNRNHYQVVYFLMQGVHLALGLPVAHLLGKPAVMKIAGSGVIPMMQRSWMGWLELKMLRMWAGRLMILNEGMRQEALAEGFPQEQLLWMPNPVDIDEFAPCGDEEKARQRSRLGIPGDLPVVLFCGRLAPEKALPSLVGGFAQAVRKFPALLVLVGDGPMLENLQSLAVSHGLSEKQIRFVGRVPAPEVRFWLQTADVFALVSSGEGFACALVEAMSTGLPSIVSDIPANTQLIDPGVHGLLSPVDDVQAIATNLERLLGDSPLRRRMGEEARRRAVAHYSTEKIADLYVELFEEEMSADQR